MNEYLIKRVLTEELFGYKLYESEEDKFIVEFLYENMILEKLLYGEPISVPELRKLLRKKIVNFEFIKLDGEVRPAKGTTMMKYIPKSDHPKGIRPSSDKVATFYDLDKDAWRSVSKKSKEIVLKKDEKTGKPVFIVKDKEAEIEEPEKEPITKEPITKEPEIKEPEIEEPEEDIEDLELDIDVDDDDEKEEIDIDIEDDKTKESKPSKFKKKKDELLKNLRDMFRKYILRNKQKEKQEQKEKEEEVIYLPRQLDPEKPAKREPDQIVPEYPPDEPELGEEGPDEEEIEY